MNKSIIGKWMYNLDDNEVWQGDEFDTKEEAIAAAKEELKEGYSFADNFQVGQITEITMAGVDVDYILDRVAENTTDEVGEVGDDYLSDVTQEDMNELEEKLNDVLFTWAKEHNYEPDFFNIENIETVEI